MSILEYHVIASPGPDLDAKAIWHAARRAARDGMLAKVGAVETSCARIDFTAPDGQFVPEGSWFVVCERGAGAPVAKACADDTDYRALYALAEAKRGCEQLLGGWQPGAIARVEDLSRIAQPAIGDRSYFRNPLRPDAAVPVAKQAAAPSLTEAERRACAAIARGL